MRFNKLYVFLIISLFLVPFVLSAPGFIQFLPEDYDGNSNTFSISFVQKSYQTFYPTKYDLWNSPNLCSGEDPRLARADYINTCRTNLFGTCNTNLFSSCVCESNEFVRTPFLTYENLAVSYGKHIFNTYKVSSIHSIEGRVNTSLSGGLINSHGTPKSIYLTQKVILKDNNLANAVSSAPFSNLNCLASVLETSTPNNNTIDYCDLNNKNQASWKVIDFIAIPPIDSTNPSGEIEFRTAVENTLSANSDDFGACAVNGNGLNGIINFRYNSGDYLSDYLKIIYNRLDTLPTLTAKICDLSGNCDSSLTIPQNPQIGARSLTCDVNYFDEEGDLMDCSTIWKLDGNVLAEHGFEISYNELNTPTYTSTINLENTQNGPYVLDLARISRTQEHQLTCSYSCSRLPNTPADKSITSSPITIPPRPDLDYEDLLYAYFNFENTYSDKSRNGNDFQTGYGSSFTPSYVGNGLDLGTAYLLRGDDFFQTKETSKSLTTDGLTTMFWIKGDALSSGEIRYIIDEPDHFGIYYSNSLIHFQLRGYNTVDKRGRVVESTYSTPLSLKNSEWTHLAFVWDSQLDKYQIYVNGALVKESINSDIVTRGASSLSEKDKLTIGMSSSLTYPFKGSLDEVKIYDKALTPGEISSSYNFGGESCTVSPDSCTVVGESCNPTTFICESDVPVDNNGVCEIGESCIAVDCGSSSPDCNGPLVCNTDLGTCQEDDGDGICEDRELCGSNDCGAGDDTTCINGLDCRGTPGICDGDDSDGICEPGEGCNSIDCGSSDSNSCLMGLNCNTDTGICGNDDGDGTCNVDEVCDSVDCGGDTPPDTCTDSLTCNINRGLCEVDVPVICNNNNICDYGESNALCGDECDGGCDVGDACGSGDCGIGNGATCEDTLNCDTASGLCYLNEICWNGVDDDGDGLVDFLDATGFSPDCPVSVCVNQGGTVNQATGECVIETGGTCPTNVPIPSEICSETTINIYDDLGGVCPSITGTATCTSICPTAPDSNAICIGTGVPVYNTENLICDFVDGTRDCGTTICPVGPDPAIICDDTDIPVQNEGGNICRVVWGTRNCGATICPVGPAANTICEDIIYPIENVNEAVCGYVIGTLPCSTGTCTNIHNPTDICEGTFETETNIITNGVCEVVWGTRDCGGGGGGPDPEADASCGDFSGSSSSKCNLRNEAGFDTLVSDGNDRFTPELLESIEGFNEDFLDDNGYDLDACSNYEDFSDEVKCYCEWDNDGGDDGLGECNSVIKITTNPERTCRTTNVELGDADCDAGATEYLLTWDAVVGSDSTCVGGSRPFQCPSKIALPFFTIFNVVLTLMIVLVIYGLILIDRKRL